MDFLTMSKLSPCLYRKTMKNFACCNTLGTHDYETTRASLGHTYNYIATDFCAAGSLLYTSPIAFRVILLTQWGQPATGILGVKS